MALSNEELEQRLIAAEKRIESSAVHSKRKQAMIDEILASQKDLRAKQEELERQFRLKKQELFNGYKVIVELHTWFLDRIKAEADALDLEMKIKIREEEKQNESANKKA